MKAEHLLRSLLGFAVVALFVAGCSRSVDTHKFRLGIVAGNEERIAEVAARIAREKYGVEVELVPFSDYVTPNAALADGSIDANAFQHRPYLEQQIKDRGYRFAAVGNTFVYPIAGYSRRFAKLSELPDGARIAVPNDPTNLGRSLLLLQKQGLLQLRTEAGVSATVRDITENSRQFRIVELEAPQLPRALPDVDLAIINTTYAGLVGLVPTRDGLFIEDRDSPYVNLIVAREDNRDSPAVQALVKAYQTEEVFEAAQRYFVGGVVKGW